MHVSESNSPTKVLFFHLNKSDDGVVFKASACFHLVLPLSFFVHILFIKVSESHSCYTSDIITSFFIETGSFAIAQTSLGHLKTLKKKKKLNLSVAPDSLDDPSSSFNIMIVSNYRLVV